MIGFKERLGRRIKQLRMYRKIQQQTLAKSVGFTAVHMGRVEAGQQMPRTSALGTIAETLGVDLSALCIPAGAWATILVDGELLTVPLEADVLDTCAGSESIVLTPMKSIPVKMRKKVIAAFDQPARISAMIVMEPEDDI